VLTPQAVVTRVVARFGGLGDERNQDLDALLETPWAMPSSAAADAHEDEEDEEAAAGEDAPTPQPAPPPRPDR
jgi:hypothetical protein